MDKPGITFRAFLTGVVFAAVFAVVGVNAERFTLYHTVTQIPVLPYVFLFAAIFALNPVLKRIRLIRPFTSAEILIVFVMAMVSAGTATIATASYLVPISSGLFNKHWNTGQSRWDIYVEPYVKEGYFIAEPGTREAAIRLRDADAAWREAQKVLRAARSVQSSREQLAAVEREFEEIRPVRDKEQRLMSERPAQRRRAMARATLKKAERWWKQFSDRYDVREILAAYPEKVDGLEERTRRCGAELDAIEAAAFEKVESFRRGLPKDMRAAPGLIYVPGEGTSSYMARFRRLIHGSAALRELQRADELLRETIRSRGELDEALLGHLRNAVDELAPISRVPEFAARKERINERIDECRERKAQEEKRLKGLHSRRRHAHADEADGLAEQIAAAKITARKLEAEAKSLENVLEQKILPELEAGRRVADTRSALAHILTNAENAAPAQCPQLQERLWDEMGRFRSFDASLERFLVGDIDWAMWLRPLLNWSLILALSYVVLWTFNILVFRQWAHNEKIIYPLAELPWALADTGNRPAGSAPLIFRSGLFWAGVAISAGVLGWNVMVRQGAMPGVGRIQLTWWWAPYLHGSIFAGIGPYIKCHIFFTLIGLTFLIPARTSYSLWFFYFACLAQLLVLVWLGYGVNERSFPVDKWVWLNFRTAEGGGALLVFVAVMLWRCRKYIFCCVTSGALAGLGQAERSELRISSWVFVLCSIALIAALTWGLGISLLWSALYYLFIMMITMALMRVVTEGGILGYKCWFTPFHIFNHVPGINTFSWTSGSLMAPLFIYHAMLFYELKAFIAPYMANALKIRDKLGLRRLQFHGVVLAAIVVAFVVGVVTHIILGYHHGADSLNHWTYGYVPKVVFGTVSRIVNTDSSAGEAARWWLVAGGLAMAGLLYFRRRVFWLPHPIGMIMLINPLMHMYWFSILIGWVFKVLVSKYGNKDTYNRFRYFFIGLIVGEIILCVIAPGVSLDRN